MTIIAKLKALNDENFPVWSDAAVASLQKIFSDFGCTRDEDVPAWFSRMLDDVLTRREDHFLFDYDDVTDSNMGSILIEVQMQFGWNIDDQGEAMTAVFEGSGMHVRLSREARYPGGRGCNSLTVSFSPKRAKPGHASEH